jgi:hypothetical protein
VIRSLENTWAKAPKPGEFRLARPMYSDGTGSRLVPSLRTMNAWFRRPPCIVTNETEMASDADVHLNQLTRTCRFLSSLRPIFELLFGSLNWRLHVGRSKDVFVAVFSGRLRCWASRRVTRATIRGSDDPRWQWKHEELCAFTTPGIIVLHVSGGRRRTIVVLDPELLSSPREHSMDAHFGDGRNPERLDGAIWSSNPCFRSHASKNWNRVAFA